MKRWTQATLGICLAATVVACSNDRRDDANARPADSGAAVGTAGANAERDFIADQLEDGQAEVNLGKLAAERASNPRVKEFAQMMVRDHQMAGDELKQAATAANVQVAPPAEPDGDHKEAQEELAKLTGSEFDRKYIDKMIDEHQEAVNEVEKKVDSDTPQVRQWATKTLPKIREHLEHARQIKETLDKADNPR
jgi:putative membrane protein